MKKDLNNIGYAMYICLKNDIKVTHSYNKELKKCIIEVYCKGILSKCYSDNPINIKELNEALTKTWIYYSKKL